VARSVVSSGATPERRRIVRVEHLMGTVVSVDVRNAGDENGTAAALDALFDELRVVEARFSPFIADSEVSRISRGELGAADAHPDVRWILGACEDLRRLSDGAFDAWRHRRDGGFDPSAIVKGWSIDEAAHRHLAATGHRDYQVNAGGDVVVAGEASPGTPWRIGIRHPDRADALAAVLSVRDRAIATSGLYERGAHIEDPLGRERARELKSLTVVGPSLTWADAYATAAFAMGLDGLAWVAERLGYGGLAVTGDDRLVWTPVVDPLLVDA
jgi:thiamine biosynthesis lipoprotein